MKGLSRDHKLIPPQPLRMKRDERFVPFNFTDYMQAFSATSACTRDIGNCIHNEE